MTHEDNILIVDDEPKICQFLEVLLRREGYRVGSVFNAADALVLIEKGNHDLIVTDLKMPGMDGFGLIRRIRDIKDNVPIIMITGYATVENAVKAMRHGVDDYVTKPFNIEELRKVIARTLHTAHVERENADLLLRLQKANDDLERHKELLVEKVVRTGSELRAVNDVLEEHRGRLDMFQQLSCITTTERDLNRLLDQALVAINSAVDAESSSIMLCEGDSLVVRACCRSDGDKDIVGTRQPRNAGIAGYVARLQQVLMVRDLHSDDRVNVTPGQEHKPPSFISVPVLQRGRTLGVVNVGCKRDGLPFAEKDLDVVTSVANQIAPAIENTALYHELEERCVSVLKALATTIEAKDQYTSGHSRRVSNYACALAKVAGANDGEVELLRRAAELHDIGKIAVAEMVLDKPGRLSADERTMVCSHPAIGERIIEPLDFLQSVQPLIRHHHERMDGKGYPDGLHGSQIPRLARILTIADAYDAMTSERPYRPAMNRDAALQEIKSCAGQQFDTELANLFESNVVMSGQKTE